VTDLCVIARLDRPIRQTTDRGYWIARSTHLPSSEIWHAAWTPLDDVRRIFAHCYLSQIRRGFFTVYDGTSARHESL